MKQCCLSVEREAPANPTLRKTATPHDFRAFRTDSAARVAIERWRDGKRFDGIKKGDSPVGKTGDI